MAHESRELEYRPDLDGLRAVAILLVVAAHAKVPGLAGGFVGVDVFFVLSGFLITALLRREISATGRVDLLAFYARRLRRLLPALIFMIVVVTIACALLLAPVEHAAQAVTAQAALLWISNFLFAFESVDYFGPSANTNMFLHTWSLGVEEQFYLVWPLLLMFFVGALAHSRESLNQARLQTRLAGTLLVCFALSLFLTASNPPWAFYLMPSRAWQFALGGLAALVVGHGSGRDDQANPSQSADLISRRRSQVGWLGLALIVGSGALLHGNLSYPGTWALAPSLGAAFVLLGCATGASSLRSALGSKPLQKLGRVSYSWYLWHWPVLLLGAAVGMNGPVDRLVLVILSLAIAAISYRYIESPIRTHFRFATLPKVTIFASVVLIAVPVLAADSWQRHVAAKWQHGPQQERYARVRFDLPSIYDMGCDEWFYDARVHICAFGEQEAEHTAVMIGDSLMGQWFPAIARVYARPDWRLLVMTKSACPMVDESFFYERIGRRYTVCEQWRAAALETFESLRPDVVFVGSSIYQFDEQQWIAGTRRVLEQLAPFSGSVLVFRTTPRLPFDGLTCLARRAWRHSLTLFDTSCTAPASLPQEENVHRWIKEAAKDFKNVSVLDLTSLVCPNGRCAAERDGIVVFRDSRHLTAEFVASVTEPLREIIARQLTRQ